MWYGVFGEIFCLKNFAWQAEAGYRHQGGRTAHPSHMLPRWRALILGGEWVVVLPEEELVWDSRLSLEMFFQPEPNDFAVFCVLE